MLSFLVHVFGVRAKLFSSKPQSDPPLFLFFDPKLAQTNCFRYNTAKVQYVKLRLSENKMYWLPKLHKKPYKARFIANSSSCTTTELSKLLTSCLTAVKNHVIRYCEKVMKGQVKICFGLLKILVRYLIN